MNGIRQVVNRMIALTLAGVLMTGSISVTAFAALDSGGGQEYQDVESVEASDGAVSSDTVEDTDPNGEGAGEASVLDSEEPAVSSAQDSEQVYTVVFDANGGFFPDEWDDALGDYVQYVQSVCKAVPAGEAVSASPVKDIDGDGTSETFLGWSLTPDGEPSVQAPYEVNAFLPAEDCTVYAVWAREEPAEQDDLNEENDMNLPSPESIENQDSLQESTSVESSEGGFTEEYPREEIPEDVLQEGAFEEFPEETFSQDGEEMTEMSSGEDDGEIANIESETDNISGEAAEEIFEETDTVNNSEEEFAETVENDYGETEEETSEEPVAENNPEAESGEYTEKVEGDAVEAKQEETTDNAAQGKTEDFSTEIVAEQGEESTVNDGEKAAEDGNTAGKADLSPAGSGATKEETAAEAGTSETIADSAAKSVQTQDRILSWEEFRDEKTDNFASLSKEEKLALYDAYEAYRTQKGMTAEGEYAEGAASGSISNPYLDVSIGSDGRFSIGNVEGNPNYSSDNYRKLLYGYPDTGTSRTLINIDGDARVFTADTTTFKNNVATSTMYLTESGITVTQRLRFFASGTIGNGQNLDDSVRIEYKVTNTSTEPHSVGVRIMLDTMLAGNDWAPFKVKGSGNVTTIRNYDKQTGIPESYQVYDDLNDPTTIATGYLVSSGEIVPDRVQFTNWGAISNDYWDYVGTPGDNLGDSAVGIYWDPAALSAGKSKTVATYYGVGVGGSISSSNTGSRVSGKQVSVFVRDNVKNGNPVAGAEVTLKDPNGNTTTGTTDENGSAALGISFSGTKEVEITVKAAGFQDSSVNRSLTGGDRVAVTLKKEDDTRPMVNSVALDGQDIMNGTVHFIDNSGNAIEHAKDSDIKKVKLVVTSDTGDCVYYLLQDNKVLDKNTTGIFELKTVNTKGGTVIEKFSSGGIREVYCVSKDGTASRKIRLGIKVSIPTIAATTIADLDLWPKARNNIAEGTIGALLIGDSIEFGLEKSKNGGKLKVEIGEDGKIKVALNFEHMPNEEQAKKIEEAQEKFKKDVAHGVAYRKSRLDAAKAFQGLLSKEDTRVSLGVAQPLKFEYGGYAEGVIKDGKADLKLAVLGTASLSASYTVNYFWIVPLYVTVGASGEVTVELSGSMQLTFEDLRPGLSWNGSISPSVSLWVEGGFGTGRVAKLGVEGKGTLSYSFTMPAKHHLATLTGEANLKAKLLALEKSLNLAKATVKLLDSEDWNGSSEQGVNLFEELEKQPYKLRSRDYMLNEMPVGSSEDDAFTVKSDNVYLDSEPVYVYAAGQKYKFWIDDDMDRNVSNGTKLMYSVDEGGWWSSPEAVDDDGTADFAVDAAYDGNGKIYVVWENSSGTFDDETVTLDEMGRAQEICLKVLNTQTGTFEDTVTITSNEVMDAVPVVTSDANAAYVAWARMVGSLEDGNTENSILSIRYSSGTLDNESSIDCGRRTISELTASIQGGKPVAVYALADIENGRIVSQNTYKKDMSATSAEEEIFAEDGAVLRNIQSASLNGQSAMFWTQDGNINYQFSDSTQVQHVFSESYGQISEFTLADGGDRTCLIWKDNSVQDAESEDELPAGSAVLYAVDYVDGKWGNPYVLYDCGCDAIHSIHAEFAQDGHLILSYIAVNYDSNGDVSYSQMTDVDFYGYSDAALTSFDYDSNLAEGGKALPVKLTVSNVGTERIDDLNVEFSGDGEPWEKELHELNLLPGESRDIEIDDFIVSETVGTGELVDYTVSVSAENDGELSNGQYDFVLGYTDLFAEQLETTVLDGRMYYPVKISNISRVDAQNVSVKVLADSVDGSIIYDNTLDTLAAGDYEVIYISEGDLEGSSQFYTYLSSDTPMDNEGLEYTLMACSKETLRVLTDVKVDISAGEGGTITGGETGVYLSGEEIELSAEPGEGYVFDSWTADKGTFANENEENTVYYVPEEDAEVIANFVKIEDITGLGMSKDNISLNIGETETVSVTADQSVRNSLFTWTSDNPDTAQVNSRGKITAKAEGTAVITAQAKNNPELQVTCTVTVLEPRITSIRMTYPKVTLNSIGEQKALKIDMVTDPVDAESKVKLDWSSDKPDIVQVDEDGNITAMAPGTAVITVRPASQQDGISAQCTVAVQLALEDIPIYGEDGEQISSLAINIGDPDTVITAGTLPTDVVLTEDYVWISSDEDMLTIQTEGDHKERAKITANLPGTATLSVSNGDTEKNIRVTVKAPARRITLSETRLTMRINESKYLTAEIDPENTTDPVTWESADTSIAGVYSDGEVYGRKAGTTTITVKAGNVTASCKVTVRTVPATGLTLSQTKATITKGEGMYLTATVTPSDSTDSLTWSSSNTDVATVSSNGWVDAYKVGTAKITAKAGKYSKTCTVTVQQKQYDTVTVTGVKGFESDYTDASTHQYANSLDKVWKLKTASAVRGVRLKFDAKSEFENNYDYLEILDKDGEPVPVKVGDTEGVLKLTGTNLQNQTITITSLPIRIHMHTDSSVTKYGFKVSSIKYFYNISKCTASLAKTSYTYTGKALQPAVTVKSGSTTLKNGTDYTVTYKANKAIGVASVVIKGKAGNSGSKTLTFKILPKAVSGLKQTGTTKTSLKLTWTKQSGITGYKVYKYASSKYTLVKTISNAATNSYTIKSLKAGTPYQYAVAAYKASGSTTLIGGKKLLKVYTVPSINTPKVTAGTKQATLKWNKVTNATGYEVYASDSKSSGFKKAATIKKGSTVTATIKNLKSKKTKYFRIRAYIKTASGTIYSAYSAVVSCKVK